MRSDDLIAFVDESLKPVRGGESHDGARPPSVYAVAAVVVLAAEADGLRAALNPLKASRGGKVHYSALSGAARLEAVVLLSRQVTWDALVVETNRAVSVRNDRTLRRAVLWEAFATLQREHGVVRVIAESRSHPSGAFGRLDHDDVLLARTARQVGLVSAPFVVSHARGEETLLTAADVIVGARTDAVCGVDRTPWSLLAHRVSVHRVAPQWRDPRNAEAPGR